MCIVRDRAARTIKLTQKRLTAQLVDIYGLKDCKSKTVPLSTSLQLTKADGEYLDKDTYTYTHLIGSVLYLSVCTRPDIAQALGALSEYMAEPTAALVAHWQAAKGLIAMWQLQESTALCLGGPLAPSSATAMQTMPETWTQGGPQLALSSSFTVELLHG